MSRLPPVPGSPGFRPCHEHQRPHEHWCPRASVSPSALPMHPYCHVPTYLYLHAPVSPCPVLLSQLLWLMGTAPHPDRRNEKSLGREVGFRDCSYREHVHPCTAHPGKRDLAFPCAPLCPSDAALSPCGHCCSWHRCKIQTSWGHNRRGMPHPAPRSCCSPRSIARNYFYQH